MPQDLADFCQRSALTQPLRGQGVTKLMRTRRGRADVGAHVGVSHQRSHRTRAENAADGRTGPQEHATVGAARSSVPQVRRDRFADVRWSG